MLQAEPLNAFVGQKHGLSIVIVKLPSRVQGSMRLLVGLRAGGRAECLWGLSFGS